MGLFHMLAAALLLLQPVAVRAQTVWDMPTEYPQSAMPGLGVTIFAKHVVESSAGKLQIRPSFDAASGIRSAGMLTAIAEGRVQAGDAFAGALVVALGLDASEHDPLAGLAVTTNGFHRIGAAIARLGLPTVLVQEGGYLSDILGANLTAVLAGFEEAR